MTPYEMGRDFARGLVAGAAEAFAAGGSTNVHVNVPVTAAGSATDVFSSPRYQQALQEAVQEVVLRYSKISPAAEPGRDDDDDDDGLSGALVPA